MTHSEIFRTAHQIARETKAIAGSYRIAFSCALRKVYAELRHPKTTAEKLEALGISAWERGDMKRYYLDDEHLEAVFGLWIDRYKTGNICSASLNGEGISNAAAGRLIGQKIYFDAVTEKWMQRRDSRAVELCETLASALRI